MGWLVEFAENAERTDRFAGNADQLRLLAAGLMGEAGSVLTELKKEERERDAYPAYRKKMLEEIGDFLWYFVRITSVVDRTLIPELELIPSGQTQAGTAPLPLFLELGAGVGRVLDVIGTGGGQVRLSEIRPLLDRVWMTALEVARMAHIELKAAAESNTRKIESRWPQRRTYSALFDDDFPDEDRLPRTLDIEFRERASGDRRVALLRCNGINFGDRLTDNIEDSDGYRFHDVFHFAYAVHLGWSPVVRALLRCKRKSNGSKDEGQDGARAAILEEAVSATIFSRAKQLNYFDDIEHVDYDLLKTVREFVQGFEVEIVPLWQWEVAILSGFSTFRKLRSNRGGTVRMDLIRRQLTYLAPT